MTDITDTADNAQFGVGYAFLCKLFGFKKAGAIPLAHGASF
jgi:hypothetical protein